MPIHIFKDREGFSVWSDAEEGVHKTGRCIGTGSTLNEAIGDGEKALLDDLHQLALTPPAVIEE